MWNVLIFASGPAVGSFTVLVSDGGVGSLLAEVSMLAMLAYDRQAKAGRKRDLEGASNREEKRRAAIAATALSPVVDARMVSCKITAS